MRENEKAAQEELERFLWWQWHDGKITEEQYFEFKENHDKPQFDLDIQEATIDDIFLN